MEEELHRVAKVCHAFSNGVRLKLAVELMDSPMHVNALAEALERDQSSVSRQLTTLKAHDIVQSETQGRKNVYELKRPDLVAKVLELAPLLQR